MFAYTHRETPVHRLDPRVKLFTLALFSAAAVTLQAWPARAVLAAGLLAGLVAARMSLARALKGARLFLLLAALVVVSHAVAEGSVSPEGAERGARVATGFLLVVFAAGLTLETTSSGRIAAVLHWLLAPIPRVNAGRIALMAALALRHAGAISALAGRVREAATARGLSPRRRPLWFLGTLSVALLRETVMEAEGTISALAARGYNDVRTPPRFEAGRRDVVGLGLMLLLIAAAAAVAVVPGW